MFSWFLLTRSISGVNTTGVPLAELSLYMTYRTEAQRPPGDSQTLWTLQGPGTAPIGRLPKTRVSPCKVPHYTELTVPAVQTFFFLHQRTLLPSERNKVQHEVIRWNFHVFTWDFLSGCFFYHVRQHPTAEQNPEMDTESKNICSKGTFNKVDVLEAKCSWMTQTFIKLTFWVKATCWCFGKFHQRHVIMWKAPQINSFMF